jgi:uncharacterized protein
LYRGRAIEPIARASIEQLLPDARLGDARFVGGYWTRDGRLEVDLVGGTERSAPTRVSFLGSVKWRQDGPFDRADAAALAASRAQVPGAEPSTPLVGVSGGRAARRVAVRFSVEELAAAGVLPAAHRPVPETPARQQQL